MREYTFKSVIALLGLGLGRFIGGFDGLSYALFVFMAADYLSGVLAAWYNRELNSYAGLRGIIKKVLILILVGVAATLDGVMGLSDPWIRTAVISFILANEGISILENVSRSGVEVPEVLKKLLYALKDNKAKGVYK